MENNKKLTPSSKKENGFTKFLSEVWFYIKEFFISFLGTLKKIFASKKTIVGSAILLFFILVAIFGPMIFPYDANTDVAHKYLMNSLEHPFGTDWLGRDVFRQVIAGTASVLQIGFISGAITVVIGTVLGILAGYVGGWIDRIIMAITNIFLSIPSFPVYLLLAALLTLEDVFSLSLVISLWSWASLCRSVRVQVMSIKERDYIQICKVMNMSKAHIIFRELLPNVFSYIAINFVLAMRNAIMASVGIMLVGLAAYDPTNWGAIMNAARMKGLANVKNIYILLYPLVCIVVFQIGTLILSNGLDETLNPRLRIM